MYDIKANFHAFTDFLSQLRYNCAHYYSLPHLLEAIGKPHENRLFQYQ